MKDQTTPPKAYWVISTIAVLWNVMGILQFFTEYGFWKNPETRKALGEMAEPMGAIYDITPGWLYVVFAIAVVTGFIGSVGLLLKKKWSIPVLLVSLVAVVIQMAYFVFVSNSVELLGMTSVIMPSVVILFALFLWYYSKRANVSGWLS